MIIEILWTIFVFILSAIPLHIAVRLLGGKTTILKTAIVSLLAGIAVGLIKGIFDTFGGIIAFLVLIWIYREMFRLKWIKAFLAWILQFVVVAIIIFILAVLGLGAILL